MSDDLVIIVRDDVWDQGRVFVAGAALEQVMTTTRVVDLAGRYPRAKAQAEIDGGRWAGLNPYLLSADKVVDESPLNLQEEADASTR